MQDNWKTSEKMAALSPHISIISLNVNRLNSPIKRHRVAGWLKKQDPTNMLPPGITPQPQSQTQTQSEGMEDNTPS